MELTYHQLTQENGIARITFNRPKHNVLNMAMMQELTAILAELNGDSGLKCVVIAAQGASWCAGVEVLDHKPELAPDMILNFDALLKQIHAMSVPTIAAVNGACLGGGMEVAIACDIVVAARSASIWPARDQAGLPAALRRRPSASARSGRSRAIRDLYHRKALQRRGNAADGSRLRCLRRRCIGKRGGQSDQGDPARQSADHPAQQKGGQPACRHADQRGDGKRQATCSSTS